MQPRYTYSLNSPKKSNSFSLFYDFYSIYKTRVLHLLIKIVLYLNFLSLFFKSIWQSLIIVTHLFVTVFLSIVKNNQYVIIHIKQKYNLK